MAGPQRVAPSATVAKNPLPVPPSAPVIRRAQPVRPLVNMNRNLLHAPLSKVMRNPQPVPYAEPVMENPSRASPSAILVGGHLYAHGVLIRGTLVVPYAEPVMENPLRAPLSGTPMDTSQQAPYAEHIMENPLRAPPSTPVIEDTLPAPHAHSAMERPLTAPHSATVMNNQLRMPVEGRRGHVTRPTHDTPGPHCKPEDVNIRQKCWELLMTFQLRRETIMKWGILLRSPISKWRKELAEGLCEGMTIIKAYMDELKHAMPDRQRCLNSRVWHLRVLLSTLLDVGIDFESMPAPVCILEFLRDNPCQFSDQFRHVIRQTYLDGESLQLGVARS